MVLVRKSPDEGVLHPGSTLEEGRLLSGFPLNLPAPTQSGLVWAGGLLKNKRYSKLDGLHQLL